MVARRWPTRSGNGKNHMLAGGQQDWDMGGAPGEPMGRGVGWCPGRQRAEVTQPCLVGFLWGGGWSGPQQWRFWWQQETQAVPWPAGEGSRRRQGTGSSSSWGCLFSIQTVFHLPLVSLTRVWGEVQDQEDTSSVPAPDGFTGLNKSPKGLLQLPGPWQEETASGQHLGP